MRLSAIERKVINSIQKDIYFEERPFKRLSGELGMGESELLESVKGLRKKGIIRSFAAGINHQRLGFTSTLIALRLVPEKIGPLANRIVKYSEVTHCFLREGEFNLWLVFITPKKKRLRGFVKKLTDEVGKENILNLKTKRQFKLKTDIRI